MSTTSLWATGSASGLASNRNSASFPWGTDNGGPQRNSLFTATDPGNASFFGLGISTLAQTARQSYHWGTFSVQIGVQTFPAQTWTIACEGKEGNAAANQFTILAIYIYRNGTGKIATIYDSQTELGTEWTGSDSGQSINVSGASVGPTQNNDYLVVEFWFTGVQSMATAYAINTQLGGNTTTTQFKVTVPNAIYLSGETQPNPVNVTPGVGSLVLTGIAPTVSVSANQNVVPGVGLLQLDGFAPTIQAGSPANVTPAVGSLVLNGFAPTVAVSDNKNVTPAVGSLALNGFAPTVQTPRNVTPGVGQLVLDGFAPTVSVSNNLQVSPGVGALVLNGFAPTVSVGSSVNAQPGIGSLVLNGFAPAITVSDNKNVFPGLGQLVLQGLAPTVTVSSSVNVTPGVGVLQLEGFRPFVVISGVGSVPTSGQLWPRGNA